MTFKDTASCNRGWSNSYDVGVSVVCFNSTGCVPESPGSMAASPGIVATVSGACFVALDVAGSDCGADSDSASSAKDASPADLDFDVAVCDADPAESAVVDPYVF